MSLRETVLTFVFQLSVKALEVMRNAHKTTVFFPSIIFKVIVFFSETHN